MSYGGQSQTNASSKLPIPSNYNSLLSLQLDPQDLNNMPEPQKIQYFTKIKKQANYFLLTAFRALEEKNYKLAKDILVYIADSCSCIHPPDKESQELIELCCEQLAQIKRVEQWVTEKKMTKKFMNQSGIGNKKLQLFVMKYDKFSGEFMCDQSQKKTINPEVLFYLSKINAILFGEQTTQNLHSMLAMLKLYSIQIMCALTIILLVVLTQMTNIKSSVFGLPDNSINYPALILSSVFLVPLLVIFFKSPLTKNSAFFQHRLTQQIKKINQQCRQNGHKIVFMMPQGMELNVKVEYDKDDIKDDMKPISSKDQQSIYNDGIPVDFSRIRKRVTTFIQKKDQKIQNGEEVEEKKQNQ